MPFGFRNLRIGPKIGVGIGAALGQAGPFNVLLIGDSQIASRALTTLNNDTAPDQAYNVTAVQTQKGSRRIAQVFNDPPTYDITLDNAALQCYTGTSGTIYMPPDVVVGKQLTAQGITGYTTTYAVVGLACSQMVPTPSPMYPTGGPSWFNQMVAYQRTVETTQGPTKLIIVSSGNNDGVGPGTANRDALRANMGLLYSGLVSAFPGAIICWIIIPADTINFPAYLVGTFAQQLLGFADNPAILPIDVDDRTLLADHAHLPCDGMWVFATRAFWTGRRAFAFADPRPASIAQVVGFGPATHDNGTSAPTADGQPVTNDLELMFNSQQVGSGQESTLSTPTGWTLVGSGTSTTNPTTGFAVRLALFRRTVTSVLLAANHNHPAATSQPMDSPNTLNFSEIITVRGPSSGAVPTVAQAVFSTTTAGATTTLAVTGLTAGANARLIAGTCAFAGAVFTAVPVSISGAFASATIDRNGVVKTPNNGACIFDIQSVTSVAGGVVSAMTATLGRSCTSPVTVLIEIAPS